MTYTSNSNQNTSNNEVAAMVELMKAKLQTMHTSSVAAAQPVKKAVTEATKDQFSFRSFFAEAC